MVATRSSTIGLARRSRFSREGPTTRRSASSSTKGMQIALTVMPRYWCGRAGQRATICARAAVAVSAQTSGSKVPSSWAPGGYGTAAAVAGTFPDTSKQLALTPEPPMSRVTTISGIGTLPAGLVIRGWRSVRGVRFRRLAPVLGDDLVHLAVGQDVRLPDRQSAVVVTREDLGRLRAVGGLLQGPSARDQAVVGDQHGQAGSLEGVPDAGRQFRGPVGGVGGYGHGRGVQAGDDVVHRRDGQAQDGQRGGLLRVRVHDRVDVVAKPVDRRVQRRLRRWRSGPLKDGSVQVADDDVLGLHPVVLDGCRRDRYRVLRKTDAEVA